jgi:hypothetical protein
MWIKTSKQLPIGEKVYQVFDSSSEINFPAKWNGEEYGWSDEHGDRFNECFNNITHWFDFSKVDNPSNLL